MVVIIAPALFMLYKIVIDKDFRTDVISFTKRTKFSKDKLDRSKLLKHDLFLSKALYKRYIANIIFIDKDKEFLFEDCMKTEYDSDTKIQSTL